MREVFENINADEPEKISKTLFTFVDSNGHEQHDVVEKVDKLLKKIGEFLPEGALISVVGSSFQGHALPIRSYMSDIDIMIYYNGEIDSNKHPGIYSIRYDVIPEFERSEGVQIDILREIELDELDDDLAIIFSPNIFLSGFVYPTFGDVDLINEKISKVRSVIKKLSNDDKDKWLNRFSQGILNDTFTKKPLGRRGLDPELKNNIEIYRNNKLKLVRERIKSLFID